MSINPARIELITFDCYGTLVDWETGILSAMHAVLERHGVHASAGQVLSAYARAEQAAEDGEYVSYREVLRRTFTGMARDLGFSPQTGEIDTLADSVSDWRPFPDTVEALQAMSARHRLGIISNVDDDMLSTTVSELGVEFDVLVTASGAHAYKPSPVIFDAALEASRPLIHGDRGRWLHAGCSLYHDVLPAKALGISSVHVLRQSGRDAATPVVDDPGQPDHVVPDLAGLWRWLSESSA